MNLRHDEGLPVVVVDEEIYRLLPSLIIGTVDKFAQLTWRGETQVLFGRVTPALHQARLRDRRPDGRRLGAVLRHLAGTTPRTATGRRGWSGSPAAAPAGPDHPGRAAPDLGPARLAGRPLRGGRRPACDLGDYPERKRLARPLPTHLTPVRVRPKVIASSATVRRAPRQIGALFDRHTEVFPPPGIDIGDNFFARQRPPQRARPGRRYMGICAHGTRMQLGADPGLRLGPRRGAEGPREVRQEPGHRPVHDARRLLQQPARPRRHAPPRRGRRVRAPHPRRGPRPGPALRPAAEGAHLPAVLDRDPRASSTSSRCRSPG